MDARFASIAALASLLLPSAAPPLPQAARRPVAVVPQPGSPVRCVAGERPQPRYVPLGGRTLERRALAPSAPPPPAPPPPPPPPPIAASPMPSTRAFAPSANVVVTAARVAPYGARENTERYDGKPVAAIQSVADAPVSTFSVDVDTGAYANARRFLNHGEMPPAEAVRTEEFINYFRYDYPRGRTQGAPFSVSTEVAATPWNKDTELLRIGLRASDVDTATRPAANLVFLVDVSGSMNEPDKLPLVKSALTTLADRLTPRDRVSIVVYAGNAGIVLEPTANKDYVKAALSCLQAGGSTAGGQGIQLAYATARANFVKGGINRIFLATDGDFNVGVSDTKALEAMVKRERDGGVTLTTLGFGQGNFNDAMMERIADVGNGNYAYIDSAMEAEKVLDEELSATLVTVAKDVKVQVEFNPAQVSQYRLIGYENRALREEDFRNDAVDAGDVGAGHQVTALYEVARTGSPGWTGARRYAGNRPPAPPTRAGGELAFVKLRYKAPDGAASREIAVPVAAPAPAGLAGPRGDFAFVAAVAAFGQKLRGDTTLGAYSYRDIGGLAGGQPGYWRQEFGKLVQLAGSHASAPAGGMR